MTEYKQQKAEFIKNHRIICFNCREEPEMNPYKSIDPAFNMLRYDCPNCFNAIFVDLKKEESNE